jgi:hypothetical protein
MRRLQRLIAATVLVALSSALAGCGSMGNFDPSDLLDFLDTKKKLPGDRKPVFPEGVPGLEQGVPKDLYKGARQVDDPNAQVASAPAAPPPEAPKSKRGAKSKGKPAPAAAAPAPAAEPAAAADPDAASAQAQEDRAQAHHRAAGGCARRPVDGASTCHATIRCTVPGPDAERHFHALSFHFPSIDTPFKKGR